MTRVLIADDSPIFAHVLAEVLGEEKDLSLTGVATDGAQAVAMTRSSRPDVIVMDVVMPVLDGFEAVSRIMAEQPTPILMMTGDSRGRLADLGFEALRRGAVDLVLKPAGWPFSAEERRMLRDRVRAAAGVRPRHPPRSVVRASERPVAASAEVVGVAASTGGPAALALLLRAVPPGFPAGIAIVQHLSPGFVDALARWIAPSCPLRVSVASDGDACGPGTVLIAPDDRHLTIDARGRARLSAEPRGAVYRPSADVLFESIAASFGRRSAGIVLTGMGDDGARGLAAMRRAGAVTIAQDEASSVVFGMPRAAIASGAAEHVVPLEGIAEALCRAIGHRPGSSPP